MATLASTNVTGSLSANNEQPVAFGPGSGLLIEHFRCAGGAAGSDVVLTPRFISKIKGVFSQQASTSDASTSGTTSVTLTLTASSTTSVTFDAWIVGTRE